MAATAVPVETATKSAYANEQKQHAKPHAETQQHAQDTLLRELLENDAKYHASRIENTVGCALNVQRAKKELTVTNFERFKAQMRHDASDISVYLTIAKNKHITNPKNWQYLPTGHTVLVILARYTMDMTAGEFEKLTKSKKIHPAITREQAKKLAEVKSKRALTLVPARKPSRTSLVKANETDEAGATERSDKTLARADTAAPAVATTGHDVEPTVTKKARASAAPTADNDVVFAADLEEQLPEVVKSKARGDVNYALRQNGIFNRRIVI
jgi:hypothetical protein